MTKKQLKIRPTWIALYALLTTASGCNFWVNDLRGRAISGQEAVYDPLRKTGTSAQALNSDQNFKSLRIEIQAIEGFNPGQEAINRLQLFLEKHLNKPQGIQIVLDEPIRPTGAAAYTLQDVRRLESRNRLSYTQKDQIAVYILFVDGDSADDVSQAHVLAQAHQNTSIVIYEKTLRELAREKNANLWLMEAAIMAHEMGHLMGLVNIGTPTQNPHQDVTHGNHCSNPNCLMHHSIETPEILQTLGSQIPDLDVDCQKDLQKP